MQHRGWYVGLIGAVAVAIGLFVLRFPVFLDAYDAWGWQIKCGTGFAADPSQAQLASGAGTDYVHACSSALMIRRLWTIPLVAVGAVIVVAVLVRATLTPKAHSISR